MTDTVSAAALFAVPLLSATDERPPLYAHARWADSTGTPLDALVVGDADEPDVRMLVLSTADRGATAAFNIDLLLAGDVRFMFNSFRGDLYEGWWGDLAAGRDVATLTATDGAGPLTVRSSAGHRNGTAGTPFKVGIADCGAARVLIVGFWNGPWLAADLTGLAAGSLTPPALPHALLRAAAAVAGTDEDSDATFEEIVHTAAAVLTPTGE